MISFTALRVANRMRLPEFRNAKGEISHPLPNGADWSPADWMTAIVGELGELANVMKKVKRGDFTQAQAQQQITDELADVVTYLDILALQYGVDLGEAVARKFNRVSMRVTSNVYLSHDGNPYRHQSTHRDPPV